MNIVIAEKNIEVADNIRDDSDLPIILVSEDEDINMLIKAFDNGANDYFTVPFNANIFAAKLKAIERRRTWDLKAN